MSSFSIVDLIYRWRTAETKDKIERKLDNEFYVTDLIYCPLKYWYQKQYRELTIAASINPTTILGEVAHYGIEKLLLDILGAENVKTEVEFEREVDVDKTVYIVKGRVDAIVGDYIVEIKTGRADASIPYSHHVMQVRIYLWISGFRKALLLYLTANRIAEFEIDTPATEGEVSDLIRSILARSPAPRYQWECAFCIYAQLCPRKTTSR